MWKQKQTQEKKALPFLLPVSNVDQVKIFDFPVLSHRKNHFYEILGLILNSLINPEKQQPKLTLVLFVTLFYMPHFSSVCG